MHTTRACTPHWVTALGDAADSQWGVLMVLSPTAFRSRYARFGQCLLAASLDLLEAYALYELGF
jgi:hypothetical protein